MNNSELDQEELDDLLSDKTANKVALLMAQTDLGKNYSEQAVRDICRAFACNLRRLKEKFYGV